jgi:H+/Cl- antiporter ClcA
MIGVNLHKAEIIRYGAEIDEKLNRPKRIILGLVATLTGYLIVRPFGDNGYFNLDLAPYSLKVSDLGWVLIVAITGAIVGLIYTLVDGFMENAFKNLRTKRTIILALIGGVGLGILAAYQPLVLFSGHEGIRTISTSFSSQSASYFLIASLLKVLAACICLATGWKGGRFFPLMFAGAAIGLFLAQLLPIPETLALSVGMSATLSYVLRKPIVAAVLLFLFFPVNLYIPIALSAFIADKLAIQVSSLTRRSAS